MLRDTQRSAISLVYALLRAREGTCAQFVRPSNRRTVNSNGTGKRREASSRGGSGHLVCGLFTFF
jgi:hypothetical protein